MTNLQAKNPIKVLMFGFEYPPFMSGGLGVACEGLNQELVNYDLNLTFVLPRNVQINKTNLVNFLFAEDDFNHSDMIGHPTEDTNFQYKNNSQIQNNLVHRLKIIAVQSGIISPYNAPFINDISQFTPEQLSILDSNVPSKLLTTKHKLKSQEDKFNTIQDLKDEVERYASKASQIATQIKHDVIHAHDWLSFGAGILAKKISKKPLIAHIHSTEFERSGGTGGINEYIYSQEKYGFEQSDLIIAVSNMTKDTVVRKYNINPDKIKVVHNGNSLKMTNREELEKVKLPFIDRAKKRGYKIVLYMGRLTIQKNPEMIIRAAQGVLKTNKKVLFVYGGTGDLQAKLLNLTHELGISNNIHFAGFLSGPERDKMYASADAFIMPSYAEPFGLVALEAQAFGSPVIISKQSGVSEVLKHALKVDFWDEHEFINKINAVLNYSSLSRTLATRGKQESHSLDWKKPAEQCYQIYRQLV